MGATQQVLAAIGAAGGGGGFDVDAQALFDRIVAAGSSITDGQKDAVNDYCVGCKADSIWTQQLDIGLVVGSDLTAALIKLKKLSTGWSYTNYNFIEANYDAGIAPGGGGSKYLDTEVTASALTSNSTGLCLYNRVTAEFTETTMGAKATASAIISLYAPYNDDVLYTDQYSELTELTDGSAITGGIGFIHTIRSSSSSLKLYRNGSAVASASTLLGALPVLPVTVFKISGREVYSQGIVTFIGITSAMNDTEAANFYTRVQALQTALGRQV